MVWVKTVFAGIVAMLFSTIALLIGYLWWLNRKAPRESIANTERVIGFSPVDVLHNLFRSPSTLFGVAAVLLCVALAVYWSLPRQLRLR